MGEQETKDIAVLQDQIISLKERLNALEKDVQSKFDRIEKKLDDVIEGRPTWTITILLSSLMTISTGLIVYLVTH